MGNSFQSHSSKHHTLGLDIRQKIIEIAKFNQQFAEETLSPLLLAHVLTPEMTPATSPSPSKQMETICAMYLMSETREDRNSLVIVISS
jgi:hypothetical protein